VTAADVQDRLTDVAARAIGRARALGADAADAVIVESTSLSVTCRLGRREEVERSETRDMGLRVFVGDRHATVSTNDFSTDTLDALARRAVAMARAAPEDPYAGLAPPERLARHWPDLDLFDDSEPDAEVLLALALEAEEAARAVAGITNSLGASASASRGGIVLATTNGFLGASRSSGFSLSCAVVAGEGTAMERDHDSVTTRHFADLRPPADIGRTAGERAVRRLGARKVASARVPVVYDPRVSRGLLGHLAGAISGAAVARGTSFLKDAMGTRVMADGMTVIDDPHRPRGLSSRPFDGEGVATSRMEVVCDGRLATWLLDCRSARQLGLETTGHASRGIGGPPSPAPSNLYLAPGTMGPEDLVADIASGFYVTDLMGMGANLVTGDYSRGAAGFWIENGEIAWPVSEVTIAGNLKDMFLNLVPANDLEFRYGINAPTVRVEGMTVAGT